MSDPKNVTLKYNSLTQFPVQLWSTNKLAQVSLELLKPTSDKFYLMFEREIQIWPKVLVKKVTMQCTRMKTHTGACYHWKITKTNNFPPILVTSIHKTGSF